MSLSKLIISLILACPLLAAAQGYVMLNEVLADNANNNSQANEVNVFGNASDWIELYNPSGEDADLMGLILIKGNPQFDLYWTITNATRFTFTNHVIVSPNTWLRIWCDNDNTNGTDTAEYHTGWALGKGGDYVLLVASDGSTILDSIGYGLQLTDLSLGRIPDGYGEWQLTVPTPGAPNEAQALGDYTQLRINEWCPTNWDWWVRILKDSTDTNCGHCKDDWIELYSPSSLPVALSIGPDMSVTLSTNFPGWGASSLAFSNYSYMEAGGYLRFWAVGKGKSSYSADEINVKLSHSSGETITLTDRDRLSVIDTVTFPSEASILWVATNSIIGNKTNNTWKVQGRLPDGDTNFILFPVVVTNNNLVTDKSTPGNSNFLPLTNGVYINELVAHTDPPIQDAIEFMNVSTNDADISNYWFTNDKNNIKKYHIPPGTIVPAGGYKVLYEIQFNSDFSDVNPHFTLNSAVGDSAYLYSATADGTLTGYRRGLSFDSSANGISFGRYTNSQGNIDFVAMSQMTFGSSITSSSPTNWANSNAFVHGTGAPNGYPLVDSVVISEIMYHPPDIIEGTNNIDNSLDEYIEIFNRSTTDVYLYDTETLPNAYTNRWRIHRTVDYKFPTNQELNSALVLPPGGFMLFINFDPWEPTNETQLAHFRDVYHIPASFTNMYGPYGGKLANKGGTIELYKPDPRQTHGIYLDYVPQILVEQIQYNDKYPWPTNADGNGYALQRIFPQGYGNNASNWIAAPPSPGSHAAHFESVSRLGSTVTLTFQTWPNLNYTVQRIGNLVGNSATNSTWTTVSNVLAQTAFATRQVTDTVPAGENRFYRIITPPQ